MNEMLLLLFSCLSSDLIHNCVMTISYGVRSLITRHNQNHNYQGAKVIIQTSNTNTYLSGLYVCVRKVIVLQP